MSKDHLIRASIPCEYSTNNIQKILELAVEFGAQLKSYKFLQENNNPIIAASLAANMAYNTLSYQEALENSYEGSSYIFVQFGKTPYENSMRFFFFRNKNKMLIRIDLSGIALKNDFYHNMYDVDFYYYLNILLKMLEPFCITSLYVRGL